jgi:CheY-like chemotaxis protein
VGVSRSQYSVLVVDDHDGHRYAVARGLQKQGYRTVEAASGAEGLELAPFVSAVVLDVHLPDVHGYEVCRMLRSREDTRALPIVHVSAVATGEADRLQGEGAGADGYMVAPLDPQQLAQTLEDLIERRMRDPSGGRSGSGATSVLDQMTQGERRREPRG